MVKVGGLFRLQSQNANRRGFDARAAYTYRYVEHRNHIGKSKKLRRHDGAAGASLQTGFEARRDESHATQRLWSVWHSQYRTFLWFEFFAVARTRRRDSARRRARRRRVRRRLAPGRERKNQAEYLEGFHRL